MGPARDEGAALAAALVEERSDEFRRNGISGPQSLGSLMTETPNDVDYWNETRRLVFISLAIWAFFSFVIHMFAPSLNRIVILGFPLGFYMAAQGSLVVFVVQIFWFAREQDRIDREHGVAED